jgi:hypothetical protein
MATAKRRMKEMGTGISRWDGGCQVQGWGEMSDEEERQGMRSRRGVAERKRI